MKLFEALQLLTLTPEEMELVARIEREGQERLVTHDFEQERRQLAEIYAEVVQDPPTDAEINEMARLDHAKKHHFPAPHEL